MKKSISPISGIKYEIPTEKDKKIKSFIEQNACKKVVAVQGLGFVGTVMSLVVANNDNNQYCVIGVDQPSESSYWKIGDINNCQVPVVSSDPLVADYFNESIKRSNFYATHDHNAYSYADVIIVDINLDVTKVKDIDNNIKSYDVPMDSFKNAMRYIGKVCKPDALILVETTVPPGTCKKIVKPIILEELKQRNLPLDQVLLGHSYERVMPGPNYINSIKNFYRVYSGIDRESADAVEAFLKTVISTDEYPLTRLDNTESTEIAKVLENSYRAMNISFAIEWSRFAELSGVNLYDVIDAIRLRPTHANLMYPGIGVGGYCLTKDPLLASWASQEFFGLEGGLDSSVKAVEKNDKMPTYCFNFVRDILKGKDEDIKIGLLGVAYGPGIGDTRFSPVENFYKHLSQLYKDIYCNDPYLNYWDELKLDIETSLNKFFENNFDVLIITTGHKDYIEGDLIYNVLKTLKKMPTIIDTVGLLNNNKLPACYKHDNFHVLGVGTKKEKIK